MNDQLLVQKNWIRIFHTATQAWLETFLDHFNTQSSKRSKGLCSPSSPKAQQMSPQLSLQWLSLPSIVYHAAFIVMCMQRIELHWNSWMKYCHSIWSRWNLDIVHKPVLIYILSTKSEDKEDLFLYCSLYLKGRTRLLWEHSWAQTNH